MTGTLGHPYPPSVVEAQNLYVQFQVREHWLRQHLHRVRAALWKYTGVVGGTNVAEKETLQAEQAAVEWLRAEAEHKMVYYRSVLHAQGVQAI